MNITISEALTKAQKFEDEDYFYQVRAIPKINPVSKPKKKITKIRVVKCKLQIGKNLP